jgi:hypothetical protein
MREDTGDRMVDPRSQTPALRGKIDEFDRLRNSVFDIFAHSIRHVGWIEVKKELRRLILCLQFNGRSEYFAKSNMCLTSKINDRFGSSVVHGLDRPTRNVPFDFGQQLAPNLSLSRRSRRAPPLRLI